MLARLAENLFWAGRYLERAEDTALLLDVTYHGSLEASAGELDGDLAQIWSGLLEVLRLDEDFAARGLAPADQSVTEYLVLDLDNPGSIVSSVARVRENARSVRELVSTELWEAINTFYLDLRARDLHEDLVHQPHDLYQMIKLRCHTLYGVASETMPRDESWRFMALGRLLERAEMTCRVLNIRYRQLSALPHAGFHEWVQVLKSTGGLEAYRKAYKATIDPNHVVEFLLFDETFPRSVLFCLRSAESGLARIAPPGTDTRPQRLLGRVRAELEYRDLQELLEEGLHEFLDRTQQQVWGVADAVGAQFFRQELTGQKPLTVLRSV